MCWTFSLHANAIAGLSRALSMVVLETERGRRDW